MDDNSLDTLAGHPARRRWAASRRAVVAVAAAGAVCGAAAAATPTAHADVIAYLINVTVRPGYNFDNAADALDYGHRLCDEIARGASYANVMGNVKRDFTAQDDYQAAYLINQAANELCPVQIWQLRRSAASQQISEG